jgi:hypothetical protein
MILASLVASTFINQHSKHFDNYHIILNSLTSGNNLGVFSSLELISLKTFNILVLIVLFAITFKQEITSVA